MIDSQVDVCWTPRDGRYWLLSVPLRRAVWPGVRKRRPDRPRVVRRVSVDEGRRRSVVSSPRIHEIVQDREPIVDVHPGRGGASPPRQPARRRRRPPAERNGRRESFSNHVGLGAFAPRSRQTAASRHRRTTARAGVVRSVGHWPLLFPTLVYAFPMRFHWYQSPAPLAGPDLSASSTGFVR